MKSIVSFRLLVSTLILFYLPLFVSSRARASLMPLTVQGGEVKFTAIGKPGFIRILGASKGSHPRGNLKILDNVVSGELEFDLRSLDTGIGLRNEHMKETYLEVGRFPDAKLSLKSFSLPASELGAKTKHTFQGTLLLHGVSKDIEGDFVYEPKSKMVSARFAIKVSDFNINIPKYLGVTVGEKVEIQTTLQLN